MRTQMTLALMLLCLPACTVTTRAPGAAAINVTTKPADVEHCRPVGSMELLDKRTIPTSIETDKLRNQAVGLGADTLLVTSTVFSPHASAVAYRCKEPVAAEHP
jgi:hypothetical protein